MRSLRSFSDPTVRHLRRSGPYLGCIAVIVATLAFVPARSADKSDGDIGGTFVVQINQLRSSSGLSQLQLLPELSSGALAWTAHMSATQVLAHDPNPTPSLQAVNWTDFGENVGLGGTPAWLWQGFLDSPPHLATILDARYTHVGVGVVTDSAGKIWTAHRFATVATAPATTAPLVTVPPPPRPTAPPVTGVPRPPTIPPSVPTSVPVVVDVIGVASADPERAVAVLRALRVLRL